MQTPIKEMTKAQRKALALKAAKLKADGKSWMAIRQELHPGLADPVGRSLFREFGVGVIAASYDRSEAKAKREGARVSRSASRDEAAPESKQAEPKAAKRPTKEQAQEQAA
jgi:hypothetical protein